MINNVMAKGDSPYSTGFLSSNIDFDINTKDAFDKIKEDEKITSEGPLTLPFELTLVPQYLGNIVLNAVEASKTISKIEESENFGNMGELLKLRNGIDKIIHYLIRNTDKTLAKYAVGARLRDDEEDE
jgi:hypothetical protein